MASNPVSPRSNLSGDGGDVPNIKSLLRLKKKYDAPEEATLPESYKKNSEKELLWLWCAHNLVRQLKFEYPFQNPRTAPSGEKENTEEIKKADSGHI